MPIKQSKKKLKYKKTLNARKLFKAKILVLLFKNIISDAKNSINCLKIRAQSGGIIISKSFEKISLTSILKIIKKIPIMTIITYFMKKPQTRYPVR